MTCFSGKANVNAPDENGNNALHLCLMSKPAVMEFAKVLLDGVQRALSLSMY
jgi:ankyrin repeat protein